MAWLPPTATLKQLPRSGGVSPGVPQHRTSPPACALCAPATAPTVARNAATKPARVRRGHFHPVCFDCSITAQSTAVGVQSQQQTPCSPTHSSPRHETSRQQAETVRVIRSPATNITQGFLGNQAVTPSRTRRRPVRWLERRIPMSGVGPSRRAP